MTRSLEIEKSTYTGSGNCTRSWLCPNVYRIAKGLDLNGYVRNLGNVVEIVVEGDERNIKTFINDLKLKKPPISKIDSLKMEWLESDSSSDFNSFQILESASDFAGSSVIPPDVATCDSCLEEVTKQGNRRYLYPFTACTDCGPRFTVISSIPYDRERNSMEEFPLCPDCMEEYRDPEDRRYHAEATCCPVCGPEVFLYHKGNIDSDNPIKEAANLLDEGNILAMKGIGGTHLVANTIDDVPVWKLRERLGRMNQPFACMSLMFPPSEALLRWLILKRILCCHGTDRLWCLKRTMITTYHPLLHLNFII
jgi:hydrogenase maturation protein HypF